MRLRIWFATLLSVLLISTLSWSQTVQGVVVGTITDPSGAVLPTATVTLTNVGTNFTQTATTGQDGSYRFALVPPGTYQVDVKAANFTELKVNGIVVQASQTVPLNLKLKVASQETVVEVTEQTPLVQAATSELSTQVDRTTIQNAALVDRDVFSSLPFLTPSVTPGLNLNPASGGARESGTSYLLNGSEDNDNFSEGGINIHPPLESVQDFSILTNQMSAQYGRGFGAVVSANQVSGANRFHGAIYEFNRNASLNANGFFYNRAYLSSIGTAAPLPAKPKYIKNQYGGIISGPIIKDHTFFAFSYDRNKTLSGSTSANQFVPTNAALNYVKANGGPIAQAIIKAAPPLTSDSPCPGTPGTGGSNSVGCLSFFDPKTDTQDAYYGRVDHNFGPSDRLSFTANIFREDFVDKFGGGGLTTNGPISSTSTNHFHQLALDETHTFSPNVLNEFTLSHNRHYNVTVEGTGKETTPDISIDNQNEGCLGYHIGGPFEGGQVQGFVQDRWGLGDSVSWKVGRHSWKFGGGGQYGIFYRNWDLGLPGQYEFGELVGTDTPASTGSLQSNGTIAGLQDQTLSNFTHDFPYFQETSIDPRTGAKANAYRHYMYKDFYTYAQDDWKVTPRLTLNLGLRWDRYGAPSEAHNIIAQFTNVNCNLFLDRACVANARVSPVKSMWNTQNHDFGPRFGFAYDPFGNGKMAVRGGFGISYDRIFDNIWSNGSWNPPFYALIDFDASATDAINYSVPASIGSAYDPKGPNGPIPYPGKRVSVRTMDVHMKDASGQNYYFGVEREILPNMLIRANYEGALGRHLPMLENLNRYDGAGYGVASKTSLTVVKPNPVYTGFNYRADTVTSNYNALVLEAQQRMKHGLQFQTSYTYSKLLDVNSDLFAGCSTIGGKTAPYYFITNTNPRQTYGRAAFDHRHAYKFSVTYEEPFFKNGKGFLAQTLGGWSLGSFFQLYSGHPIDVWNGQSAVRARDANKNLLLDQNGVPFNVGGDYNLDGVLNDHPVFVGSSISAFYSGKNPADGIFVDTHKIGCGALSGIPGSFSPSASSTSCTSTPNKFFVNPAYPSGATPFLRFGTLSRDVFQGPRFMQLDLNLSKTFKFTESTNLKFTAAAQNLANHPSFDCVPGNLNSGDFGRAQCLAQDVPGVVGAPSSRVMTLGLRLAF